MHRAQGKPSLVDTHLQGKQKTIKKEGHNSLANQLTNLINWSIGQSENRRIN